MAAGCDGVTMMVACVKPCVARASMSLHSIWLHKRVALDVVLTLLCFAPSALPTFRAMSAAGRCGLGEHHGPNRLLARAAGHLQCNSPGQPGQSGSCFGQLIQSVSWPSQWQCSTGQDCRLRQRQQRRQRVAKTASRSIASQCSSSNSGELIRVTST